MGSRRGAGKRVFGEISRLPSGRNRARYRGPDLNRHADPPTLAQYVVTVVGRRRLCPATGAQYAKLLRLAIVPAFGDRQLPDITVADVTAWHRSMTTAPTQQANG